MSFDRTTNGAPLRRGFTLIELMISLATLTLILRSMVFISRTSEMAFDRSTVTADLELRSGAVSAALLRELEAAVEESIVLDTASPNGATWIEYRTMTDVTATSVVTSELRRIRMDIESGEIDDGIDNDGDGLIDEQQLVIVTDVGTPQESTRVIVRGVTELFAGEIRNNADDNGNGLDDEPGFVVIRDGSLVELLVSIGRAVPGETEVLTRRLRTTVMLRN